MYLHKKISALVLFSILLMNFPCLAQTEEGPVTVKTAIVKSAGKVHIDYTVKNLQKEKIEHLAITTFLARKTNRSEAMGDLAPGQSAGYSCEFDAADLLSGSYILATRVDFGDQENQTRHVYHFDTVAVKESSVQRYPDPLSVMFFKTPHFNRKSFWNPGGKFELTLKNNAAQPLEPVITFFLPNGITMSEPEKMYPLKAGEEQTEKIPLTVEPLAGLDTSYFVVAWHEANGVHYSRLITGNIRIEEAPVYFKLFMVLCAVIIVAVAGAYIFRRRKKIAGA